MEIEPNSSSAVAKKLWNIVRVMVMMMRRSISNSKSRLMLDAHVLLTRGKLAAAGMLTSRSQSMSCRSNDAALSFVSPKEYEFSCSNSPAYGFHVSKRRAHHQQLRHLARAHRHVDAVQKVLGMLDGNKVVVAVEGSPTTSYFPGFGRSPATVRPLRITDSPFPLTEADEDSRHVDVAAEEFIKNFYKDLKSQKKNVLDSPYHDMIWGR